MTDAALAQLKTQLGGNAPVLDQLSAAEAAQLAKLMEEARRHQAKALEKALEGALSHIPMLLRGPVRKVLGL